MAFESTFKAIDNTLRHDDGCSTALDYVEQSSWVLFLKYFDDLELTREQAAELLDVLEYIAYATTPIERKERAERIKGYEAGLPNAQKEFVEYLMNAYIKSGVDELGKDKLKTLLALKFGSVTEGIAALGGTPQARQTFKDFQQKLYVG